MYVPRAGIVIVGDEILAGHTQDTNSRWLAQRLRARGLRLERIETIGDDVAAIEATVRRLLALALDWVFVVGGIGPTPDDRTYEAVGRALEVPLVVRPEHVEALRRRAAQAGHAGKAWSDPETSEAMRRMIRLPQGSAPLANPVGAALGCVAPTGTGRVVVLPGVPRELYAMFDESLAPMLPEPGVQEAVEELEIVGAEASYWDALTRIEREFPDVRLGSYPQDEKGRILLRLTGPAEAVAKARRELARLVKN